MILLFKIQTTHLGDSPFYKFHFSFVFALVSNYQIHVKIALYTEQYNLTWQNLYTRNLCYLEEGENCIT